METQIMTKILTSHGVNVAYEIPLPSLPAQEWACAGADPDLFFPENDQGLTQAREICEGCQLIDSCLTLAIARTESGVWGGVLLDAGKPLARVPTRGRPKRLKQEELLLA